MSDSEYPNPNATVPQLGDLHRKLRTVIEGHKQGLASDQVTLMNMVRTQSKPPLYEESSFVLLENNIMLYQRHLNENRERLRLIEARITELSTEPGPLHLTMAQRQWRSDHGLSSMTPTPPGSAKEGFFRMPPIGQMRDLHVNRSMLERIAASESSRDLRPFQICQKPGRNMMTWDQIKLANSAAGSFTDQMLTFSFFKPSDLNPDINKENTMSIMSIGHINVAVLSAVADKGAADEFTALTSFSGTEQTEMAAAVKSMIAEDRASKVKSAAGEFVKILKLADQTTNIKVESVRAHRRKEAEELAALKRIDRAKAYGLETMNMMPLYSALAGNREHMVPDGWVAKEVPAKSTSLTQEDIVGKT